MPNSPALLTPTAREDVVGVIVGGWVKAVTYVS